jgi:hypothetical protein
LSTATNHEKIPIQNQSYRNPNHPHAEAQTTTSNLLVQSHPARIMRGTLGRGDLAPCEGRCCMSAGKGDTQRPVDAKAYGENYDAIFRKDKPEPKPEPKTEHGQ